MVVMEGQDAAGKATQSKLLAERLKGTRLSFPNYETETGKAIQRHLKKEWCAGYINGPRISHLDDCDALVFQCLQSANRLECIPEIKEALARGPVVFDRYWPSAVVYGGLDGLDKSWLLRVQDDPMPQSDVFILLDIPVEESFNRRPERRDRYETDAAYLQMVRDGYRQLFDERGRCMHRGSCSVIPCTCRVRSWHTVDGRGTLDEVAARIWNAVEPHVRGGV
jgi:dTMP kinase